MASTKRAKSKRQKSLNSSHNLQLPLALLLILFGGVILIFSQLAKTPFKLDKIDQAPLHNSYEGQGREVQLERQFAKPQKLYIPSISRILAVGDGYAVGNRWTISPTGVSFYTQSALPGTSGNTVIYGHNTQGVLGGLWRIANGDYVYVILANGGFVKYQVFEKKEIAPTQVEILNQSADSILTLYTCSGFLDTARFVVVAKRVDTVI